MKISRFWKVIIVILALLVGACVFFFLQSENNPNPSFGITFSYQEAEGLGFDWKTAYLDMLSDLGPKNLRLMTYWEDIEQNRGTYDFTISDQMVSEAERQNVNVLLVVGRKQPRWPECHEPVWYKNLTPADQNSALLDFVRATVEHFKDYSNITEWQVENEPYFSFGPDCPVSDPELLTQEIALVKSLDSRKVMVTDSGDRGSWFWPMKAGADDFGFTLYRMSYDETYGGYYRYPLPSWFYRIRSGMLNVFTSVDNISDVELQAEPWFTQGALNTPLETQNALMNPKVFEQNIKYARRTGAGIHYLWGVEWWYWMAKTNGDWGMWQAAKDLLNSPN